MLALPWEIWSDRLSRQHGTYMYILMNHWIATNTSGSNCLKNRRTCSKLHYLYTTCSKCPLPSHTNILDVDELIRCIKNQSTVWITLFIEYAVGDGASIYTCYCLRSCWRQTFRAHDVKWWGVKLDLHTFAIMFHDFWDDNCRSFCSNSMIHQSTVSTALTTQSVTSNFSR